MSAEATSEEETTTTTAAASVAGIWRCMDSHFEDVLRANAQFALDYDSLHLPGRAARGLAVVTCMDSRIEPLAMLGLGKGDAKILRNAGARVTDDVLRTLVLAVHLLAVTRVMIVAHTDCRMTKVTDERVHEAIFEASGVDTRSLEFGAISDQPAVLTHDVQRVRSSPYLPPGLAVVGCVYDVETGRLGVLVPE
jgi:carbonic anhydrase